jgi:hypothetical protein
MVAYVYLIEERPHQSEKSGQWTKIGYTKNNPAWRMDANLKRGNSRELRVAKAYKFNSVEAARKAEKTAHNQLRQFAHQKEWFQLSWEYIAAWCSDSGWEQAEFGSESPN